MSFLNCRLRQGGEGHRRATREGGGLVGDWDGGDEVGAHVCVGYWKREVLGHAPISCRLPNPPNASRVWVPIVRDSLKKLILSLVLHFSVTRAILVNAYQADAVVSICLDPSSLQDAQT